uniref:Cationic amino acid transporter C-terminal domain-containing protein n=1 Tax=Timema shepardi TaxID=629360 RepID=A0A7R9B8G5_TIMSH|nr:unnamed protein product [Timema shepardi]
MLFPVFLCVAFTAVIVHAGEDIVNVNGLAIAGLVVFGTCLIIILISIAVQPTSKKELSFKVPLVPFIPGLSILVNIYLMMVLDGPTWIRFLAWMVIGYVVYFGYGIWNSTGAVKPRSKTRSNEDLGIDNPMMDISKM